MNHSAPSMLPNHVQQLLFVGRALDFQSTADQPLLKVFAGSSYRIADLVVVRKTGSALTLCLGGIYDAANKGGNAIVSALQSWLSLAAGTMVTPALTALTSNAVLSNTPILSLGTASGAPITADIFVYGYVID